MNPRVRVIVIAAAALAVVGGLVWFLSVRYWSSPVTPVGPPTTNEPQTAPTATQGSSTPNAAQTESTLAEPPAPTPGAPSGSLPNATPDDSPAWPPADTWRAPDGTSAPTPPPQRAEPPPNRPVAPPPAANLPAGALVVPVAGVRAEQLSDTFTQSRSEGRAHNALDIMAPRGTPVVAAADGRVVKLFSSKRGGITLYQLGPDDRTVYYYAHLDRYADGIHEGQLLRRGETLGYVGDTGNSGAGNYHLHFAIWLITDPKRYWDGENVNPYPLLVQR